MKLPEISIGSGHRPLGLSLGLLFVSWFVGNPYVGEALLCRTRGVSRTGQLKQAFSCRERKRNFTKHFPVERDNRSKYFV